MLKSDFEVWRYSPTGKWFFDEVLAEQVSDITIGMANGSCLDDEPGKVAIHYAERVGIVTGLEIARNVDPFGDENETESNRPASAG